MKKNKTPMSFHVIYWIMNVVTGLFGLIALAIIVFYVMLWTNFFGNDLQLHVDLPGKVNYLQNGILAGSNIQVELVEASARIHFFNTPTYIARSFVMMLMGVMALGLFLLLTFRTFVANVRKGYVFTVSNITLLQRISYTLLAFWIILIIYQRIMYHYISSHVEIDNIEVLGEFNNYPGILLIALFIWVLTHIFRRGLKLQEEQALTI